MLISLSPTAWFAHPFAILNTWALVRQRNVSSFAKWWPTLFPSCFLSTLFLLLSTIQMFVLCLFHASLNASLWKKNDHGLEMFALRRMRGDGDSVEYVCPCPSLGRPFWAIFPSTAARSSEISGGWPKRWHFQSPETLVGGPKNTRTPRASQKYDRNRSKRCSFHRVQC